MARYRGILLAAVALVLLLPAAQRADAQDMLIVDGGGARWRSGENREPAVTVDLGIIDSLAPDRRPNASRRQYRRPRRYLTLNIPQPEPPAAPLSIGRPAPAAAPAAEPPSETQTPPARTETPDPPASAETPEPPDRTEAAEPSAKPKTPTEAAPADRPAALRARRLPGGTKTVTPALRAFLDRAAGKRPGTNAAPTGAPSDSQPPAKPARAKLPPPPRPIKQAESNAAEAATAAPAPAGASAAPAVRLPPPPPATGTPGAGVLPPPAEPKAGASTTLRRRLALDAARRPSSTAPASAEAGSERFLYEAGETTLGKGERERLRGFASKMAGQAGLDIEIRAYSGPVGSDEVEARRTALSRAMEVRRLLISAGLPEARILVRAAGVGEESAGHVDVVPVRRS